MQTCLYCLGKKALLALKGLQPAAVSAIKLVVVATDKNIAEDYAVEIREWAVANNLSCCYRDESIPEMDECGVHIAIGWRWLLPVKEEQQLIVFHDSLLPKYRGFNPLVTALLNGDAEVGGTCFLACDEMDAGPVILQEKFHISYPQTIDDAINKMGNCYAGMLNELLLNISRNLPVEGKQQEEAAASYSLWRDEADYKINWGKSAEYIKRFVDATGFPYKGAYFIYQQKRIIVNECELVPDVIISNRDAGKVLRLINEAPVVVCGTGLIKLTKMTDEQGNPFSLSSLRVRL
jgi:methionyl-tRNA formyltransferase